jgi:hypothetical protein
MTVTMVTPSNTLADYEQQIEQSFDRIGQALAAIRDNDLYREAGYTSFAEYIKIRWARSDSWARQLISAGIVQDRLANEGVQLLNARHARALVEFDDDLQAVIARAAYAKADAEQRLATASDIKTMGIVISDLATTGHVDIGNGEMSAVDAAIVNEDFERIMRQRQHIAGNRPTSWQTRAITQSNGRIDLILPDDYRGREVLIYVRIVEEQL